MQVGGPGVCPKGSERGVSGIFPSLGTGDLGQVRQERAGYGGGAVRGIFPRLRIPPWGRAGLAGVLGKPGQGPRPPETGPPPEEGGGRAGVRPGEGWGLRGSGSDSTHRVRLGSSGGEVSEKGGGAGARAAGKRGGAQRAGPGPDLHVKGAGCPGRDRGPSLRVWGADPAAGQESGVGAAVTLSNTKNSKRRRKAGGKSRE